MPKRDEYSTLNLDVTAGADRTPARPRSEEPFRILLLGDFSGRRDRGPIAARRLKPVAIDRDNVDDVLAGMGIELRIGLPIRSIDDFHPDRIFAQAAAFRALREMRAALRKPSASPEAVAAVKKWAHWPAAKAPPALATGGLLDSIVEAMESEPAPAARPRDDLRSFVKQVVAPHVLPREDPQIPALTARVEDAAGELMRAVLHDPDFQALEAAWRAVQFLVYGLETGEQLKVCLLDITAAELAEDLNTPGGIEHSALHRLLTQEIEPGSGARPWAVVAGNFTFGQSEAEIRTLARLATLMRAAETPFLAETTPVADDSASWSSLRRSPAASWLGLALPRFLLRLPYGAKTEPMESFRFEEMPGTPVHQEYLWANPAFACAYLLGSAFSGNGWDMRPGAHREVEGLPLHVYDDGGERKLKSCAELEMSERDAEWVLDQGCMPLVWVKGRSSVCLLRWQSIADPPATLSGRWNRE